MKRINTITVKVDTTTEYITKNLNVLKSLLDHWTSESGERLCPFSRGRVDDYKTAGRVSCIIDPHKIVVLTASEDWFKNAGFTDEEINTIRVW